MVLRNYGYLFMLLVLQLHVHSMMQNVPVALMSSSPMIRRSGPKVDKQENAVEVIVTTSLGSQFLNKRKKCTVSSNATIASLKEKLAIIYPGTPPVELQRLYFGLKHLPDDVRVSNITFMRPVPLLMDVISGTGAYQRNMSIIDTLEAYAALLTQQIYVNEKLASILAPIDSNNNTRNQLETSRYRQIFNELNNSIFSGREVQIAQALQRERNPELVTEEVSTWRGKEPLALTAMQRWLAHQFYFSRNTFNALITYTTMLLVLFSGGSQFGPNVGLIASAVLWISHWRPLRIILKLLAGLCLSCVASIPGLLPFLSAPYQVIAANMHKLDSR